MLKEDPVQRITSKSLQKGNTEFKSKSLIQLLLNN